MQADASGGLRPYLNALRELKKLRLAMQAAAQSREDDGDGQHGGGDKPKPKQDDDHSADADKMVKGVKKKRANPYLLTTGQRHAHHGRP